MTQFKEKAGKHREDANLGLYAYPVLMAADILVYKATHVPVGEDQKQHLELAHNMPGAFNRRYGIDYFELPEPYILKTASRIMSLRDGTMKMSKTDPSEYSRIQFTDDPDAIALKIRKAKTDTDPIQGTIEAMKDRPEAVNLLGIYAAFTDMTVEEACLKFEGSTFAPFKKELTDQIIATMDPIRLTMQTLLKDPAGLDSILKKEDQTGQMILRCII